MEESLILWGKGNMWTFQLVSRVRICESSFPREGLRNARTCSATYHVTLKDTWPADNSRETIGAGPSASPSSVLDFDRYEDREEVTPRRRIVYCIVVNDCFDSNPRSTGPFRARPDGPFCRRRARLESIFTLKSHVSRGLTRSSQSAFSNPFQPNWINTVRFEKEIIKLRLQHDECILTLSRGFSENCTIVLTQFRKVPPSYG